jgi:hypothetical protein
MNKNECSSSNEWSSTAHPQGQNNLYFWLQEWFEGQQNGSFHYRPQGQEMVSACV